MTFEKEDVKKYHLLQRLVGQALTQDSVAKGIPSLQNCAEASVSELLASDTVATRDILRHFTLDVARTQIIGLKVKKGEDIIAFHLAVNTWLKSVSNFLLYVIPMPLWMLKRIPAYKARQYLNGKIEERINELEANGPDDSTISAMVFATDEGDRSVKLSRRQIIDNIFLLILAGTETSSLTLTNAILLLGMHPDSWENMVAEQKELVDNHGENLTKELIDKECPYLDGVIKESLRLLPISFGGAREVDETIVLDGYQVPKGYMGVYSIALTHEQDPKTFKDDGSHMDIKTGFKPERWMDEQTRPTTEFMPFGAGHRFCLGHTLAIAGMFVHFAWPR